MNTLIIYVFIKGMIRKMNCYWHMHFSSICIKLLNIKNNFDYVLYLVLIKSDIKNINTTFNTHVILAVFFCVYWKRIFKNQNVGSFVSFCVLVKVDNSNKFELIHLHKNMKNTLTLIINIRLEVTRVFCILISRVIE